MAILHLGDEERGAVWRDVFAREMPELEFRCLEDVGDGADIRYLVAWTIPEGLLATLPNLEILFSVGAGIDQLDLEAIPVDLRIVRMIEPGITGTIAEYVAMAVLALHRDLPFYTTEQAAERWSYREVLHAHERNVGIMGLGVLGQAALALLGKLGFRLLGWSRSKHVIDGVRTYAGSDEFVLFLEQCDILVCMLPLTEATRGILCRETFAAMPCGASLVNVGRGGHLVQDDLLDALNSGKLSAAILDVSNPEPLPAGHPFFTDPRIVLTPHIAGITRKDSAVHSLLDNLRREQDGLPLSGEVVRPHGY